MSEEICNTILPIAYLQTSCADLAVSSPVLARKLNDQLMFQVIMVIDEEAQVFPIRGKDYKDNKDLPNL